MSLSLFKHLTLICIISAAGATCADEIAGPSRTWERRTFTDWDLIATCLCESRTGVVWVGTDDGLLMYDGGFRRVLDESPLQLPDRHVLHLHEDKYGRLWVGSSGRLTMVDLHAGKVLTTTFSGERFDELIKGVTLRDRTHGVMGTLGATLLHFQVHSDSLEITERISLPARALKIPIAHNRPAYVTGMFTNGTGTSWIATQVGLFRIDPGQSTPQEAYPDVIKGAIWSIYPDSKGNVWFVGGKNIYLLAPEADSLKKIPSPLPGASSRSLREDAAGGLWLGTASALLRLDENLQIAESFPHASQLLAVSPRDNEVLFSDGRDVLYALKRLPCKSIDPGLTPQEWLFVTSCAPDSDGVLVATNKEILSIRHDGRTAVEHVLEAGDFVESLYRAADGTIIGIGPRSCYVVSGSLAHRVALPSIAPPPANRRGLWSITPCDGGYILQRGAQLQYLDRESLTVRAVENSIAALAPFGAAPALLINEEGRVKELAGRSDTPIQLTGNDIGSVFAYQTEDQWIHVEATKGVARIDRETGAGTQWPPGLFDGSRANRVTRTSPTQWAVMVGARLWMFDEKTGTRRKVPATRDSGHIKYFVASGKTLFGVGVHKAVAWDVADLTITPTVAPPKKLSAIFTSDGVSLGPDIGAERIVRPFASSWVSLRLLATTNTTGLPEFSVKLPGWSEWVDRRGGEELSLASLAPGTHEVLIRQRDDAGTLSEPARVEIEVRPPWYQTATFYLAVALLCGCLGTAYVWSKGRQVRRLQTEVARRESVEQKLRDSQGELVKRERLSALGEMAAGVGHDINNLLSPILIYGEMLAIDNGQPAETRRVGRIMAEQASDASKIVRRLSPIYRQVDADRAEVGIAQVINDSITVARSNAELQNRGSEVRFVADISPVRVFCSASALREVLVNLLNNAVDAIEFTGEIVVRNGASDGIVWIEVEDSGCGMTSEVLERCFDALYTKGKKLGSGIGLAVSRSIVQGYGGQIRVESIPGKGATFRIEIPNDPVDANFSTGTRALPRARRVLVVDDIEATRHAIMTLLQSLRQEVTCVASADEARQELAIGEYDLVITDHGMPGETGFGFCQSLRTEQPQLPVVLISGFEEPGMREVCNEFVLKPISRREMERVLHRVLSGESELPT